MGKIIWALQLALTLYMFYNLGIYLAGVFRPRPVRRYPPQKRFAAVIPAHNEEVVIGCLVDSLQRQQYPRDLYDIYVICDNCTDGTEEEVRKAGGIPLIRQDQERKGKQWALAWAFEVLNLERYDAVCIFDADNLAAPDFLAVMNDHLCRGEKVIQGYLDTKNPDDTWITAAYAVNYWAMMRMSQGARAHLGLPVYLGGTGYCVATEVLKRYGWHVTTLVDDLEYSVRMILAGVKPTLAYAARIWDEKPLTLAASMRQRLRWMRGQTEVCLRYSLPLLGRFLKSGKWQYIDCLAYIWQPFALLLNQLFLIGYTVMLAAGGSFNPWAFAQMFAFQFGMALVPMLLDRVNRKHWPKTLWQPLFGFTWLIVVVLGMLTWRIQRWERTPHSVPIQNV